MKTSNSHSSSTPRKRRLRSFFAGRTFFGRGKGRSLPVLALYVAIVMVVGGGTAAYGVLNKTVTLSVEGHSEKIRTFGGTVSDVLKSKNVTVRQGDRLSLAPGAGLSDGDVIKVAYAKPLRLTVDGTVTEHTVFAPTVKGALQTLGVSTASSSYLSKKPSTSIPRSGTEVLVSTPKELTVVADKKKKIISTSAPTVGAALKAADITLDGDDEVRPGKQALVTSSTRLRVTRIDKVTRTETVKLKYSVQVRKDPSATAGETKVVTKGKAGEKQQKVALVLADGKVRDREILTSRTLSEPRPQIEAQGTKPKEPAGDATGNTVWDKIAQCESGGNWSTNTGNGYYGGLQFSAPTWKSVGGSGLPSDNSRGEQIKRAKILQARSGWGQWGCAGARFN